MRGWHPERMIDWAFALFFAWLLATVILVASPLMLRWLGQRGLRTLKRLMGMLLVLLSVQMFLDGLAQYINDHFSPIS